MRQDVIWQDAEVAQRFVSEVRAGVPYGSDQLAIMVRVVAAGGREVGRGYLELTGYWRPMAL